MSKITARYQDSHEYDAVDCKLRIITEADENRIVCVRIAQLRAKAAAPRRTPNTIIREQVGNILQCERDSRCTEFHNRRLVRELQAAADTLRGEATEAVIALSQPAITSATTTHTTIRAKASAGTTAEAVIRKSHRLHSIVIENKFSEKTF